MTAPVTVRVEARIAFVAIANPPVNGLSHAVRAALYDAFTRIGRDADIDGAVLHGEGACFSAGGDIREFSTPAASAAPGLSRDVHPAIEFCGKPVVAALHGFALGGGLETAMACHRRIASPDARLGLPEARLGVIPLSGTQRLPRLIGLEAAIGMIMSGEQVRAAEAPAGLIDLIVDEGDLFREAAALAHQSAPPLVRDLPFPEDGAAEIIAAARARIEPGSLASRLIDAVEAGRSFTFEDGLRAARAIYDATVDSAEAKAARAAFLAARNSKAREAT
jgi:3-hydroxyacyl-CoA dehydrogenase